MKYIISILTIVNIILFILAIYFSFIKKKKLTDKFTQYQIKILNDAYHDKNVINNLGNTPIYAINMEKSTDRRQNLKKQFDNYDIKNYKIIKAIDGLKITTLNGKQRKPSSYTTFNKSKLTSYKAGDIYFKIREPDYASNSEVGCTLSHLKAIETAYNDNNDKVIIVEDDINLFPIKTWSKTLDEFLKTAPNDWEAIYDGFNKDKHYNKNLEFIKCSISQPFGAWFYIINRKGMKAVLNKFKKNNYFILDAYKNNLKRRGLSGITADIYIPWLIQAYSCKTNLAMTLNDQNKLNSNIHTYDTQEHINFSRNIIDRLYKKFKR